MKYNSKNKYFYKYIFTRFIFSMNDIKPIKKILYL